MRKIFNRAQSRSAFGFASSRYCIAAAPPLVAGIFAFSPCVQAAESVSNSPFDVTFDQGGMGSLRCVKDKFDTNYVASGRRVGDVLLRYRGRDGSWQSLDTQALAKANGAIYNRSEDGTRYTSTYRVQDESFNKTPALELQSQFVVKGDEVEWTMKVRNLSERWREIDDWSLPLPMNTTFRANRPTTEIVLKHSFIAGDNSFLFWMRSNSAGPYLTMTPLPGTSLEYWDAQATNGFRVFIHSAAIGAQAKAQGTKWRQPNTFLRLAPAGQKGDSHSYGFKFKWAKDYSEVRQLRVDEGQIDVDVVPGMTVPNDLFARFALRSKLPIRAVEAEFPAQTQLQYLGARDGRVFYQVRFQRLGENKLTIRYGQGRRTTLEFFSTQPLETLIKKRAAFIARHQVRDSSKWYNGLLTEWNMRDEVALTPDNYDGLQSWRIYEVTCDDPGLSKPAFLAAKNADFPVQREVEALDYYLNHFVWGGLQRTTKEKYSYGLYGIPDWKQNRDNVDAGTQGKLHLWRPYDYSHVVVIYLSMYRVAKNHPEIKTALSAQEYLQRAYGTAAAMFTVPKQLVGWGAGNTGFYNETVIPKVVAALVANGRKAEAAKLKAHWEGKVKNFAGGTTDLFGSEYPFDSTGFESTHALAKYALQNSSTLGIKPQTAHDFLEKQMAANIFCRGWLETAYYYLGSDYRASAGNSFTLSYMSPMGGGAVLDYGLNYAKDPTPYLRLGYASYLSAWALMNAGDAKSNYGFWYPGPNNDGAVGGGFEPAPYGETWLAQPHHRGAWYYASETDLGYCGALRTAATLISDDSIFGRFCFGGTWKQTAHSIEVTPRDGVRKRFYAKLKTGTLQVASENESFSTQHPIAVNEALSSLSFYLESSQPARHQSPLLLKGLAPGRYQLSSGGEKLASFTASVAQEVRLVLPVSQKTTAKPFVIVRQPSS
ncbi:hypothetical protein EON83_18425 [bacterium]|nr:MAG: hypothetical protein EON83_18425 [bacterium]